MSDAPTAPQRSGARELLLRAALGALLGLVAGLLVGAFYVDYMWHVLAAIGLFLGGLTGLGGFVERLGAGRGARAQVGLALGLFVVATAWGTVALFQAEWTKVALDAGSDAAAARLQEFVGIFFSDPMWFVRFFPPLAAAVTAPTLVRMRRGGPGAHVAAATITLVLGWLVAEPIERRSVLGLGLGLLVVNAARARAARALARRWWPAPDVDAAGETR